jgi:hypothetical protein
MRVSRVGWISVVVLTIACALRLSSRAHPVEVHPETASADLKFRGTLASFLSGETVNGVPCLPEVGLVAFD